MWLRYKIRLSKDELNQPLLKLTIRDKPVYLIPSRCHEAHLPQDFTKDSHKMRLLREHVITDPLDRYNKIGYLAKSLHRNEVFTEWGIKMMKKFAHVSA
jgi:hypothetical protein